MRSSNNIIKCRNRVAALLMSIRVIVIVIVTTPMLIVKVVLPVACRPNLWGGKLCTLVYNYEKKLINPSKIYLYKFMIMEGGEYPITLSPSNTPFSLTGCIILNFMYKHKI